MRKANLVGRPAARVTTLLARAPPRYASDAGLPRPLSWRSGLVWSEVSGLFTTDIRFPGEQATRPLVFGTKESASSPPGRSIISFVSSFCGFVGLETKTPPERGLGGVRSTRTVEERQLIRPSRESARVLPHRSCDPSAFHTAMNGAARIISLSRWSAATIATNGRGV